MPSADWTRLCGTLKVRWQACQCTSCWAVKHVLLLIPILMHPALHRRLHWMLLKNTGSRVSGIYGSSLEDMVPLIWQKIQPISNMVLVSPTITQLMHRLTKGEQYNF